MWLGRGLWGGVGGSSRAGHSLEKAGLKWGCPGKVGRVGLGQRAAWSGPQEVASELRAGLLLGESLFTQWPCFLGQN